MKTISPENAQRIILCKHLGWENIELNNRGILVGSNPAMRSSVRMEIPKLDYNLIHSVIPTLNLNQINKLILFIDDGGSMEIIMRATFEKTLHALITVINPIASA